MNKRNATISGAIVTVATAVGAFMFQGGNISGEYAITRETDLSGRITISIPHERIPNATFYSLQFNESEIGLSSFGEDSGIRTAKLILDSPDDLSVTFYDSDRNRVATGQLNSKGKIAVKLNKNGVAE